MVIGTNTMHAYMRAILIKVLGCHQNVDSILQLGTIWIVLLVQTMVEVTGQRPATQSSGSSVSKSWSHTFPVSFTCSSTPGKLSIVDNEGHLPTATDIRSTDNIVEHHVTLDTGQAETQNVALFTTF